MNRRCPDCKARAQDTLCSLHNTGWAAFLEACTWQEFRPGETIFREGMPASIVYLLCEGLVKLSLTTARGTAIVGLVSSLTRPGDLLDKAALGRDRHALTSVALVPSQIACLDKARFMHLLRSDQQCSALALRQMAGAIHASMERIRWQTLPARQKLAQVLLEIAAAAPSHVDKAGRGNAHFPLRHHELAQWVGLSRESVTRLLGKLHHARVIACQGRHVTILAPDRLRHLAERGTVMKFTH